jgi:hypothetical protein
MAESNPLAMNYKRVITDYEVVFSKNYRHITVGPLQSFMKQIIPDGLLVELSVYKNGKLLNVSAKTSNQGFASFVLNSDEYPDNTYTLKIKTAGIEKSFNNIKLW